MSGIFQIYLSPQYFLHPLIANLQKVLSVSNKLIRKGFISKTQVLI